MCTYLDQVGSTYYFRRVVPGELRAFIRTRTGAPRTEWKISLKTKDRDAAKRMIPSHTIATQAEIDAAQRAQSQSAHSAPQTVPQRVSDHAARIEAAMAQHAEDGAELARREMSAKEERYDAREALRRRWRDLRKKSTLEMTPDEAAALDLIRDMEYELTLERERHLTKAVERAEDRRGVMPAVPTRVQPSSAVPLLETFDSYAAEQCIKPNTASEWRNVIKALIAFLGHDDADKIGVADLERWKAALLAGTTKRGTKREPRTVKNGYFTPLKAALNWAVENHKLSENVATKVVIRIPRKAKLRDRDFTADEATRILTASLVPASDLHAAETVIARRWIPWLCAYTGARVNEMGQLRGKDVTQIDGIWTIRITPEAGTVKANAARVVPLHPHLIEQGFLAVVEGKGDAPLFYDPGKTRRPGEGNRHFKKVGERLRDWVRNNVGISDPAVQPNHGWRHTFKSRALAANMPERIADAIQGHAAKTVGQTYGSVPLATMYEAIAAMPRFEVKD